METLRIENWYTYTKSQLSTPRLSTDCDLDISLNWDVIGPYTVYKPPLHEHFSIQHDKRCKVDDEIEAYKMYKVKGLCSKYDVKADLKK